MIATSAKRYQQDYLCTCGETDPKLFYPQNRQRCRACLAMKSRLQRTARKNLGLCVTCGKNPRRKTLECSTCRGHQLRLAREHRARLAATRVKKKVKREGATALGTSEATRLVTLLEVARLWQQSLKIVDFNAALNNRIQTAIGRVRNKARKTDPPQDYVLAIPLVRDRCWKPGVLLKSHRWRTPQRLVVVLSEVVIIRVESGVRGKDHRVVDVLPADTKEVV